MNYVIKRHLSMIYGQHPHLYMVEWYRDRMLDAYIVSWLGWSVGGSCVYRDVESFAERSYTHLSAEFRGLKTRR